MSNPQKSFFTRRRLVAASAVSLAMLAAWGCSPAGLLNNASRLVPGDAARLAASGVAFGADPRLKLDVWLPTRRSAVPLPVIIFFYGGGWASGERGDYGFAARAFAARGFMVIVPDYRLVPQVRFPAFVEDGARAVKWAQDHAAAYGGDPTRLALSGHSSGAYIAAMLSLDRHYLKDAGVAAGIVKAAALLSGPYDFYPFTEERGRNALGQWPRPAETQPIHFARADAPPMLLLHGTADTVVRPYNSQRLAAALAGLGAPVELKLYAGKSHIDTIKSLSPLLRGATPALADSVDFLHARLGKGR